MMIQSPHGKGVRHGTEYPRAYSMDLPGKKVSFPGSLPFALLWSFQALREDSNIGRGVSRKHRTLGLTTSHAQGHMFP